MAVKSAIGERLEVLYLSEEICTYCDGNGEIYYYDEETGDEEVENCEDCDGWGTVSEEDRTVALPGYD